MKDNYSDAASFAAITEKILDLLQEQAYKPQSHQQFRVVFNQLNRYMTEREISAYSPDVGAAFLKDYVQQRGIGSSWAKSITRVTKVLNHAIEDGAIGLHILRCTKKPPLKLPKHFSDTLEKYLAYCSGEGNKNSTLARKRASCGHFLSRLDTLGCHDLSELTPAHIRESCLLETDKDSWFKVRLFLNFLFDKGYTRLNYSAIVPKYRLPSKLPTVYTPEEIRRFEDAIDADSPTGIRDRAMLLLVTRFGLRPSDVAALRMSDLDFEGGIIHLTQEKTEQEWNGTMIPPVKLALWKYVSKARPKSDTDVVFLRVDAPYQGLSKQGVSSRVKQYFVGSGVDIANKRHGPCALRSSLASSLVNDSVPTEAVRRVLGHESKFAIKNYAKVDTENLRKCAIPVPEVTGVFARFLERQRI
ncbi:MAG: tyrosine-type recombinase/integrase [Oscillospiraceae bacterium]|nr:tyrosine-type recombinase/integrase [Oscillospiraceae bacterium]